MMSVRFTRCCRNTFDRLRTGRTSRLGSDFSLRYSVFGLQYSGCHLPSRLGRRRNFVIGITFPQRRGVRVPNRETYRKKALQCLQAADRTHDSSERVTLLSLASNFLTLADYVGAHPDHLTAPEGDHDIQNES
jgi:hypothetical protein